jgi:hypothetical protein
VLLSLDLLLALAGRTLPGAPAVLLAGIGLDRFARLRQLPLAPGPGRSSTFLLHNN